jgi:HEPN domain-containing protein
MKIKDVLEWIQIADEDFYSAQLLNEALRKPYEIICYHCAQATEKYLKGYLAYNNITTPKTHNLLLLHELCVEKDIAFENIRTECSLLNRFTNEIRYPHKIEIKEEDVKYSLNAVEQIKNVDPIKKLRDSIIGETNESIKK